MYGLSAKKMTIVERLERWCCGEVAIVERRSLWRGGRCREVAVVERLKQD